MTINFSVLRQKLVTVLLFGVFVGAPLFAVAQPLDARRLAEMSLEGLQSEVALGGKADNRVLKNLLWSVQRRGMSMDLERFDSLFASFQNASAQGLTRVHPSIRHEYTPEVLLSLWQETRASLIARDFVVCSKVF